MPTHDYYGIPKELAAIGRWWVDACIEVNKPWSLKPWSLGEPYPTETPWRMPDGRHVCAQRPSPPNQEDIAIDARLYHHKGEPDAR